MTDIEIWTPPSHQRREESERREIGAGMVRYFEQKGISAIDMGKAARRGPDGQTITDLSQLARAVPGVADAMGAPFATTADPGDPVFSPAAMGPGTPSRPFPLGGEPRQFQYRVGFNFPTPPDSDRGISGELLRLLADQYDLLRQLIELSKNEIASLEWDIVPREKNRRKREKMMQDQADEITAIKAFFEWPEAYPEKDRKGGWHRVGRTHWQQWIAAQLEEYFVGDFLTIWPRFQLNGELLAFERVDGSTIRPLLDSEGRQPPPPYPAWQQYLYGVPRASFTLSELFYRPRVQRNNTVYGLSHVEQMLLIINLALRWEMWVTQSYTEGSLPLGFLTLPENYTKDQISDVIGMLNASMSGLSGERQQWHGVPFGTTWTEMKPFQFDETFAQWLVEYTCAMFGYSAGKLGFMPGRGGSELGGSGRYQQENQNNDSSEKIPTAKWVQALMNELLARCLQRADLEFIFVDLENADEKTQIENDQLALSSGVKSWDQVLQERGEDPVGVSEPFIMASNGIPWSVADIKAIQDGGQRNPAPGLPLTEDDLERQDDEDDQQQQAAQERLETLRQMPQGGQPPTPGAAPGSSPGRAPGTPAPKQGTDGNAKPAGSSVANQSPEKVEKFDTSSGFQPHDLGGARADELRRWKRKATKDAQAGRAPRPFRSDVLSKRAVTAIATELADAPDAMGVRATFDRRISKAAATETSVAGLVVLADDTGRVLLIQRSNEDRDDPARGRWEFPGGHLEDGETPIEGAMREWKEETGMTLPAGEVRGQWKDGIYEGVIYAIPHEADLPLNPDHENRAVLNPDDPDGDCIEVAAWWNPTDLPDMPALRDECGEGTPWSMIEHATPATATKLASANPSFRPETWAVVKSSQGNLRKADSAPQARLAAHHYGPATNPDTTCATCVFSVNGATYCQNPSIEADVEPGGWCDLWQQSRKARTRHPEELIAGGILAVLTTKIRAAEKAGLDVHAREKLVLTEQEKKAIEEAIKTGRGLAYQAGRDRALEQLGLPTVDMSGQQVALTSSASDAVTTLSDAWTKQLEALLDQPNVDIRDVAQGLDRFADWKSKQIAISNATEAYNTGKLDCYRLQDTGAMYEWDTAGDDAVCEDCQDRADDSPYALEDLDVQELHPGCRCEVNQVDGDGGE